MSLKSGLAAQWGFKAESAWSTPVTVDKFLPLVSETLTAEKERIESASIVAGRRVLTSNMWGAGRVKVSGGIQTELFDRDIATLISHMMGDASSPYTPGDLDGFGLTVQIGAPDLAGTVQPRTYSGCKINGWEIACKVGEIATVGLDLVAAREILVRTVADGVTTNTDATITSATAAFTADDVGKPISGTGIPAGATIASVTSATEVELSAAATATGNPVTFTIGIALASASYTSGLKPVRFTHGSVTIGGSAVNVKGATLSGKNGLDTERFFLGSDIVKEPLEAELREYMCTLDIEFNDLTQYRRYLNGTEHAVVLTFATSAGLSLVITTNVRFDGATPQVGGPGILQQSIPMKCVASGADSTAISIALTEAA